MARRIKLCPAAHEHIIFTAYTRRWWGKKRFEFYCGRCQLTIKEPK